MDVGGGCWSEGEKGGWQRISSCRHFSLTEQAHPLAEDDKGVSKSPERTEHGLDWTLDTVWIYRHQGGGKSSIRRENPRAEIEGMREIRAVQVMPQSNAKTQFSR